MKHTKIMIIALSLLALAVGASCYRLTVPVAKLMSPKLDVKYKALEEEIEQLEKQYETAITAYENNIQKEKEATDKNIKAGDLEASLASVVRLYGLTHPCGEEDCGTYPCRGKECSNTYRRVNDMTPINRYEAYLHRERIDDERDFILDAVDRIYGLTQKQVEEQRFNELDVILTKYVEKIPGPEDNKQRFGKIQKNVKQLWIDTLVASAEEATGEYPGAAVVYYAKASALATEKGDGAQSKELMDKASSMKQRILDEYHYTVAIGSVSGPHSADLASVVSSGSYNGAMSIAKSGSGNATFSISTSSPSHSRSTGSTSGSFEYKSGERQVENPAWRSAQNECKEAQEDYQEESAECAAQPTNSAGDPTRQCDGVPSYQSKAERACSKVNDYPQTVTEDVMSSQSYPINLYHLDTTLPVNSTIAHEDGRSALKGSSGSARLTDEEHGAHERNGSGVSADPKRLPSESSGVSAALSDAGSKHVSLAQKSFEGYRSKLLRSNADGGAGEIHGIATYMLLEPDNISEDAFTRLVNVSKIDGSGKALLAIP